MKLGKKINLLRKQSKMTMQDLADKSGLSKGYISMLEKGENPQSKKPIIPSLQTVQSISSAFGIELEELLSGIDDSVKLPDSTDFNNLIVEIRDITLELNEVRQLKVRDFAEQQLKEQNKVISIEETQTVYLNSKLSAGTGILDLDPTDTKEVEYNGYLPKHDLAFEVSGNSMEPAFADGEIVFVEKTPDVHNGQFIAVQINEEAYIKKAYIEDERLRLVSLNGDYKDIYACGDDDIRVIGRVIL